MPAHAPLNPEVLDAFEDAQRRSIQVLGLAVRELREGQSEKDIAGILRDLATSSGFSAWYHEPEVRIGGGTGRFHRNAESRRLKPGALVELDFGPATDLAYGDVGVALAFGVEGEPTAVTEARDLCRAVCGFASRWKTVGELFVYAQAWTNNRRMSLGEATAVGHACLAREGFADVAWPQAARAATLLRRNQIQWYNPRRLVGLYAVRPRLVTAETALAFEEMIYVDGDVKRILGRESLNEVGTL